MTLDRTTPRRDCRREGREIREQYRIQQDSLVTQYKPRLATATSAERDALKHERDTKIAELKHAGAEAQKSLREACQAENTDPPRRDMAPEVAPPP